MEKSIPWIPTVCPSVSLEHIHLGDGGHFGLAFFHDCDAGAGDLCGGLQPMAESAHT